MWKPPKVIELQTGYALAAFKGFVSFWNWLANFVYHLKGDGAIVIDDEVKDRPVLGLAGFKDAEDGKVPSKSGDSLEWISPGGGTQDIEIITDFSCAIEDGFLQIKLTKAKLSGVSYESIEYDPDIHRRPIAGAITGKAVITNTHYNTDGDHVFKQNKIDGALVLYPNESGTPAEETQSVFETTLHS